MIPLWEDDDAGARVQRLVEPREVRSLIQLFEDIARREGWQPGGALRLERDRSVYFGLFLGDRLAGGLQLTLARDPFFATGETSGVAFPCQIVWPELRVDEPGRCAHIPVLALSEEARGSEAHFWSLAAEMWRYCLGEGIERLFIEVTPRILPLYRRIGWPLVVEGEPRVHWGEDCHLCSMDVAHVTSEMVRRCGRSDRYRDVAAQAFRLREEPEEDGRYDAFDVFPIPAVAI